MSVIICVKFLIDYPDTTPALSELYSQYFSQYYHILILVTHVIPALNFSLNCTKINIIIHFRGAIPHFFVSVTHK